MKFGTNPEADLITRWIFRNWCYRIFVLHSYLCSESLQLLSLETVFDVSTKGMKMCLVWH
jgi:hypothetical protein